MKIVLALVLVLGVAFVTAASHSEGTYQTLFLGWMKENNKVYSPFEFQKKYDTWKTNFDWVYNFEKNYPEATFTVEMNSLGDLTDDEYRHYYAGARLTRRNTASSSSEAAMFDESSLYTLPTSVDWRTKGVVTPVKNQGQCGSCWSFAATGSLEAAHAFNTGSLIGLSEQNLIDCSTSYGNGGCNGGLEVQAFDYIIHNRGVATEKGYPYEARNSACRYNRAYCGSTLAKYYTVSSGNETALQLAVTNVGPVAVGIDASPSSFRFYRSGVYYDASCKSQLNLLNHSVLSVGYGTLAGSDYWLVKNSWGADWGDDGYILMSRNRNNNCGIATDPSYPDKAGAGNC